MAPVSVVFQSIRVRLLSQHIVPEKVLSKHPLTATLDELVQQHGQITQDESANIEPKELGRMPSAQLKSDLGLICMSQTGILDLTGNLICYLCQQVHVLQHFIKRT
jgi:hypothetical protein